LTTDGNITMTIYFLDDDRIELEIWKYQLEAYPKLNFKMFTDPNQFKEAVTENPPDVVVIDLVMPLVSGDKVAKWVRSHYPQVRVYINTSLDGEEYKILSERSCKATFMSKNTDLKERIEVIANGWS
jgi:DNA-binding NtrC family response regulator